MSETPTPIPAEPTEDTSDSGAIADAKKYRKRAQDAEAERDSLRATVENLQRAEIARLAKQSKIHDPSDFGVEDVAELLADDGTVNAEAVKERIDDLKALRPYLFESRTFPDLGGGQRGSDIPIGNEISWQSALRGDQ